ncbi:MAG: tetratricopeptide repeat protein [Rectinemataceae bacterium]|jgi:tetratricopeptide (TPR) repeat protein
MRRHYAAIALILAASTLPALAQTAAQAAAPAADATQAAQVPAGTAPAASGAQPKLDALLMYRQGRDLETAGKQADAQAKYTQAVSVCDQELASDPKRLEAYVVKCWSLFRLGRYAEVISTGQSGMKITFDGRISEVMGESYYFLGQMDSCIRSLQKYIEVSGDSGDRGPTAYFFMGEAYLRQKKYSHADIAYSMAVLREPSMSRWWFRLGNACESMGEWKRALDAYNKALALSPAYPEAQTAQARAKAKVTP